MAQSSSHWIDRVIPKVPVRQWVLTFPIPLRYPLTAHPPLLLPILGIFHRTLASFPRRRSKRPKRAVKTGAISVVQRFELAANRNIHVHALVPEGLFELSQNKTPVFAPAPVFDAHQPQSLQETIVPRILRCLVQRGFITQ